MAAAAFFVQGQPERGRTMGIEPGDLADATRREVEEVRVRLSDAAGRLTHEAASAGGRVSALVFDELDRRGSDLGDGLQQIADRLRGFADTGDGTPPRMVQQAVDLIDDLSQRLRQKSARDLHGKVARFGRDNPATFFAACLATGVLTGRFVIAQGGGTDRRAHLHRPPQEGVQGPDEHSEGRRPGQAVRPQETSRPGLDLLPGDGPGARPDGGAAPARDATGEPVRDTPHG